MAAVTAALSPPCERGKSGVEDELRDLRTDTDDELLSDPGIEVEDDADVNGVDNETGHKTTGTVKQNLSKPSQRMDSYRLSMANLESSQDVELDAILGELCALGSHFDRGHARSISGGSDSLRLSSCVSGATLEIQGVAQQISRHSGHSRSSSGGTKTKYEIGGSHGDVLDEMGRTQKQDFGLRTDSPDNDSAFSDNVSMLSSESSASSGAGVNRSDVTSQNICGRSGHIPQTTLLSQARIKSEKIKLAMEKIQESHIKRIFIKAYTDDDCAKSLLVDERMTVAHVCRLLSEKIHTKMDPQWAVVERNFDLQLDRIYEDHENLVKNILMWTQDATHKLLFLKKEEKYEVFLNPEDYLLGCTSSQKSPDMDDEGKATLLEEFFSATRIAVPEMEGSLFLKSDGKKAWKKYFFVLRATGLYYNPKGKSKLSKDLVCLTSFEENNVYIGFNWRKKYKSPTDFGFAIKNSEIQIKCCRSIKFLCAEDSHTLKLWMTGIRIAKYGHQLKENYDGVIRDIDEEDIDTLAHARSFSVSSMAKTLSVTSRGVEIPDCWEPSIIEQKITSHLSVRKNSQFRQSQGSGSVGNRISFERRPHRSSVIRRDSIKSSASSSSSGCSSVSTPTNDQIAFEADFPVGTIKRKPSMAPKIPLTSTTRTIAKQSMSDDSCNNVVNLDTVQESTRNLSSVNNTLGRNTITRMSLRRSHTEDKIDVNDVSKVFQRKHSIDSGTLTKQVEKLQAIANGTSVKMSSVDSYKEMVVNNFSDVDDLPLPPPPPELETREEIVQRGILPSPPPEAFNSEGSTLSLDSLPPPPPPLQLDDQVSWPSTSSINSLPPPPSANTQSLEDSGLLQEGCYPTSQDDLKFPQNAPLVPPKPKQHGKEYRSSVGDSPYSSLPQVLADEQRGQSNTSLRSSQKPQQKEDLAETSSCGISPSAVAQQQSLEHPRRFKNGSQKRGISFCHSNTEPQLPNSDISSPTQIPNIYQKPEPPIRSETTRLSHQIPAIDKASYSRGSCSGQGQLQPIITPPEYFLRDLQRVMEKKWKVAQQLSIDLTATPHQIMGFRDPCFLPPESSAITHAPLHLPDSCHTNHHPKHHHHHHHHSHKSTDGHSRQTSMAKKKAPPPPPKRSESTHLTRRQ
ncbi:uncharacterized protein LOC106462785 isoform X2 [Limulus polyphemus]|uniref:Uncharacterized protein LOC106462785 isoform X2 n=1 Tax=Limulus polyphemus TaxID=6850 RepID=A0ABM1SQC5_LIMPO|nr:uncharacterized protein LOC106462785 isoform X2 [Limulus polyphemus]